MDYAYQIFGNYFRDEKEFIRLSTIHRGKFLSIPGLKEIYMFSKMEEGLASLLCICGDEETAENAKVVMNEILSQIDEDVGFRSEFIFKLLETVKI